MKRAILDLDAGEVIGGTVERAESIPKALPRYSPSGALERRRHELTCLAQHSSKSQEHYTPTAIIERARALMGGIDLDPASSFLAQRRVQAARWFGYLEDGITIDGLMQDWHGRVFLNPPGGSTADHAPALTSVSKSYAALWWGKLISEYNSGRVTEAVFVGFSLELLLSVQGVTDRHPMSFPMCIPSKRIAFDYPEDTSDGKPLEHSDIKTGTSPTHGNFIVWLPPPDGGLRSAFVEHFSNLGVVLVR